MSKQLEQDHDRLRAIMAEYVNAMSQDKVPEIQGIMKQRLEFANLFRKLLSYKSQKLEKLIEAELTSDLREDFEKHRLEMKQIFLDYTALVRVWTPERIVARWTDYCHEIRAQWVRFVAFLAWEEEFFQAPAIRRLLS